MSREPIIAMEHRPAEAFKDEAHVRYALRDLFSQTATHMMSVDTERNFIAEYDWDQKPIFRRAYHNNRPAKMHERFVSDFSDLDLADVWQEDVTYFAFIILTPLGWVSNFLSGVMAEDGTGIAAHDAGVASYCLHTVFQDDIDAMQGIIGWMVDEGEKVHDYRKVDLRTRIIVDKALYAHLNKSHPVEPIISVLHNDEDAPAHFHRVIWAS